MPTHSDERVQSFLDETREHPTLELKCYDCGKMKPTTDFYKDKWVKRGYKNYCKDCLKKERELRKRREDLTPKGDYLVNAENKDYTYDKPVEKNDNNKRGNDMVQGSRNSTDPVPENQTKKAKISEEPSMEVLAYKTLQEVPLLNFKEVWKPDKNYAAAFIAPRESGKSTMIKYLYPYWKSIFDKVIFFTKSYQADIYDFLDKKDKNFIITHWDLRVLKYLEYLQRKSDNAFRFLIIFDDMLNKGGMRNSEVILDMFTRGRNMNCSIIISMQSSSYLHPDSRKNLDFAFLLGVRTKEDSDSMYERLMEGIAPIDLDLALRRQKNLFFDWMHDLTQDFWCVFINYRKDAEGNRIHKIKAPKA